MNKGANHSVSGRDFWVGQKKRGSRRELGPFGTEAAEGQDVAASVSQVPWWILKDSPLEESDFNKAYKIRFWLLHPEIELPLFLN